MYSIERYRFIPPTLNDLRRVSITAKDIISRADIAPLALTVRRVDEISKALSLPNAISGRNSFTDDCRRVFQSISYVIEYIFLPLVRPTLASKLPFAPREGRQHKAVRVMRESGEESDEISKRLTHLPALSLSR